MRKPAPCLAVAVMAALLGIVLDPAQPGASADIDRAGAPLRVALVAAVPLSPCADSDHGPQTLTSLTLSPSVLDVRRHAGRLNVAATIVDTGGPGPARGAASIDVRIANFSESPPGLGEATLLPADDGTFRGVIQVPRGVQPRTYKRLFVEVTPAGGDHYFHDRYNEINPDLYAPPDLVAAGLHPQVTIVSHPDRRGPRITNLKLSRTTVDTRGHRVRVRVEMRVHDAGSGVASANVSIGDIADVALVRGTRGRWTGAATVGRYAAAGAQDLFVDAADRAGNSVDLEPQQLARRSWPSTVHVQSRTDTTRPIFRIIRGPGPVIDVRLHDGQAVTLIRAIDRGAGVRFVGLGSFDTDDPLQPGRLVSGTRHNGIWRVVVPLPHCATSAMRWTDILSAHDGALNEVVREVHYRVINTDVVQPDIGLGIADVAPSGPVTVRFSELVTGISDAAAPIRPTLPTRLHSARQLLGPPVPGTWACRTPAGAPTDCATGAYRDAAWTPAVPMAEGRYVLDLNPDHVLDVTDLAGNPFEGNEVFSNTGFDVSTSARG
jgi:hypothetical protein